jgi:drug/metabolite transporter (DMT)-like permease
LGVALLVTRSGPQKGAHPALLSVKPWSCVTAGAVLAVHWITLFAAYKRAPAGTVILVVYLAPVGIAAIAPRVLGEALPARTLAALGVAVTGFALVAWPAVGAASIGGLVYAVAAAVTFVVLVLVSKPLAESYGGLRLAFMETAGAGLLILPVAAKAGWGRPEWSWAWLLVLGLVHTALGTGLYLGALGRVPATHVGILGYIEPASVVLCGWLFLSQRPAAATVAGGALILLAGLLVVRSAPSMEEVVAGVAG